MHYIKSIKELRKERNVTQETLATIIGIKRGAFATYEAEIATIPLKHLIKICDYFNVSLDYIFKFTEVEIYEDEQKNYNVNLYKKRLKELRGNQNISQARLGIILNCPTSTIASYESGKYLIKIDYLYNMCKRYEISADYLLGKTNNKKYR